MKTIFLVTVDDRRHGPWHYVFSDKKKAQRAIPHEIRKEYQANYGGVSTGKWLSEERYAFGAVKVAIEEVVVDPFDVKFEVRPITLKSLDVEIGEGTHYVLGVDGSVESIFPTPDKAK